MRANIHLLLLGGLFAFQTAHGRMNAHVDSATATVTVDGQPQQVAVVSTGAWNWPTQWRATLELTPGPHH